MIGEEGFVEVSESDRWPDGRVKYPRPLITYRHGGEDEYEAITIYTNKKRLLAASLLYVPAALRERVEAEVQIGLSPHRHSYLSEAAMRSTPQWLPCRDAAEASKSLRSVADMYQRLGRPWLNALRQPVAFAQEVREGSFILAALAYETAGDVAVARQYYEKAASRFEDVSERTGGILQSPQLWNDILYVSEKIGWRPKLVDEIEAKIAAGKPD